MQITVKLFAGFRNGRFKVRVIEFEAGIMVTQVIQKVELPEAEVGILICNGRHIELTDKLEEGDVLSVFPKVGGG
jgi:molybdopterin converting factor small subunit